MRYAITISVLCAVMLCAACSFSNEFAVVNESGQILDVRYTFKKTPFDRQPLQLPERPRTLPSSQLNASKGRPWVELSADRYRIDPEYRTVSVRLMPGEALLIADLSDYSYDSGESESERFPVEKIEVSGVNGSQIFTDRQTRKAFSTISGGLHTLVYKSY